jgi:integrase
MAIKQDRETGLWTVSYSKRPKGGGHPVNARRRGIRSRAEAKRVERELVIQVENKLLKKKVPTWEKVSLEFIGTNEGVNWTKKTAENYLLCLQAHTFPIWGSRTIDKINGGEIRDLLNVTLGNKSESHRKSILKYINGVFNYAVEREYLMRNPAPKMKFRIGDKIQEVLTEEQAKYLLKKAKELNLEWYPIWATALYTGLRNGELYALTWDCIKLKERKLIVKKSWNNKEGFKNLTKSRCDRIVEIAPPLVKIFRELKKDSDSIYVLPRIDKWDKGEQARELRMFLAGLGLPQIRFHDLRATWATILLGKGVVPAKLMVLAGWKDLKTMVRYIRKAGIDTKGATDDLKLT